MNKIKEFLAKPIPVFNTKYAIYTWYAIALGIIFLICVFTPSHCPNLIFGIVIGTVFRVALDFITEG